MLSIGRFNRALRAEDDHPSMGGQISQDVCKGAKVGYACAENFVAPALAYLVGFAGEVALHRGVAFCVRQLVGIKAADRANDAASKFILVGLRLFEEGRGLVVNMKRFKQVGITV